MIQALLITAVCSWLFYDSWMGLIWGIGVLPFWCWRSKKKRREEAYGNICRECRELLQLLSSSLQAGYSAERAFVEAEKEMAMLYGKRSRLVPELKKMNRQVLVNRPVEEAFLELTIRCGVDEMGSLGYIFCQAKRAGGDYGELIRSTAEKLEENLRTKQEIQTMTAQKRLELRIMSVMPVGILCYIRITSPDFISALYHNTSGVFIMSICLVVYGAMIALGDRLIRIEV